MTDTATTRLSYRKAQATLNALKTQYANYLVPVTLDDGTVLTGSEHPTLIGMYDGRPGWFVIWTDGRTPALYGRL